jgi:lipopolysaccharide transport system permease protein
MVRTYSASLPAYVMAIVRYRDLIVQLIRREFMTRYRGSILGILWAVLNPVLMVLIFSFLFNVVFQARWVAEPGSSGNFVILALLGMIIHGIFAESVGQAPHLILSRASYVKKVLFPLEILPIVTLGNALISAAIGLAVVLVAHWALSGTMSVTVLLLPIVLLPFVFLVTGIVLFVGAIGVYLRDLAHITNFVIMAALFLAPVFYPVSMVPEKYRFLLYLNPLTFTIEQAREVALFGRLPDWQGLFIYTAAALVFAWFGLWWFQRTRKGFADVI